MRDPFELAMKCLTAVAPYDRHLAELEPADLADIAQAWSIQIQATNLVEVDLLEGVRRAYSQSRLPSNPIGSIISEAKAARSIRNQGLALPPRTTATNTTPGPIMSAYQHDNAINYPCNGATTENGHAAGCGAKPGEFCTDKAGNVRKIPCTSRLAYAYAQTQRGKERRAQRLADLKANKIRQEEKRAGKKEGRKAWI